MPIETLDPPIAAYEAVRSQLALMAEIAAFRTAKLRRASPEDLALSLPHRVAHIPFDRIKRGMKLRSAAIIKDWRFLVLDGDDVAASATATPGGGGEYRFGQLNEGPFADGTGTAIVRAEADQTVQQGHFEPVLLMIPTIYVVALWLRDREGEADLVLPIDPLPTELSGSGLFPVVEFCAVLTRLAAQRSAGPVSEAPPPPRRR